MRSFAFAILLVVLLAVPQTFAGTSQVTAGKFFEIIRKFERTHHPKKTQIEAMTGRNLHQQAYWQYVSDENQADVVPKLETTLSREGQTTSVLLYVNPDLHISPDDVRTEFGDAPKKSDHSDIKSISFEYEYEHKWGWTTFMFEMVGNRARLRYAETGYRHNGKS